MTPGQISNPPWLDQYSVKDFQAKPPLELLRDKQMVSIFISSVLIPNSLGWGINPRVLQHKPMGRETSYLCWSLLLLLRPSAWTDIQATFPFHFCQVHNFMQMLETKSKLSLKTWPQGPTQYMPMGYKQRVLQLFQHYQVLMVQSWGGAF